MQFSLYPRHLPAYFPTLFMRARTRIYVYAYINNIDTYSGAMYEKTGALFAPAACFTIPRAFLARFSRCREHIPRVIAFGFPTALDTFHFV